MLNTLTRSTHTLTCLTHSHAQRTHTLKSVLLRGKDLVAIARNGGVAGDDGGHDATCVMSDGDHGDGDGDDGGHDSTCVNE